MDELLKDTVECLDFFCAHWMMRNARHYERIHGMRSYFVKMQGASMVERQFIPKQLKETNYKKLKELLMETSTTTAQQRETQERFDRLVAMFEQLSCACSWSIGEDAEQSRDDNLH